MNNSTIFTFIVFGTMVVMGLFTYIPFSDGVNLTDEGTYLEGSYEVSDNWETAGTLTGEMNTDGNLIYPTSNQAGTWTSDLIHGERFNVVQLDGLADTRDGTINYTINLWNGTANGVPDNTITGQINDVDFQQNFTDLQEYETFEVVIDMEETAESANKRPNVDSLNVDYIENLDRSGLGFTPEAFQAFTLLVFIGAGVLALIKSA